VGSGFQGDFIRTVVAHAETMAHQWRGCKSGKAEACRRLP
jgi:hypothetical protein